MRKIYILLAFLAINLLMLNSLIRVGMGPSISAKPKSPQGLVETLSEEILRRQEESLLRQLTEPSSAQNQPIRTQRGQFDLQGIFWGTPQPQAIINRRILRVGDKIGEAQMISIGKEGVTLLLNGQELHLKPARPDFLELTTPE